MNVEEDDKNTSKEIKDEEENIQKNTKTTSATMTFVQTENINYALKNLQERKRIRL